MRITRNLIAGFQNAPDIAHTGNTRSPYFLDAERRAETCPQSPSPQIHPPKGERDCVLTTAYRLLPETWARTMKALQIRPKWVQSGGVKWCVMNDSKDTGAWSSSLNKRHKKTTSKCLWFDWALCRFRLSQINELLLESLNLSCYKVGYFQYIDHLQCL